MLAACEAVWCSALLVLYRCCCILLPWWWCCCCCGGPADAHCFHTLPSAPILCCCRCRCHCRERALVSQDPKTCVSADTAAGQIAAVINRSALPPSSARGAAAAAAGERGKWTPRQPPTWFLAAGNARLWWTMGVIQKLWGWPVNSLIQKAFKMDKKLE